MPWCYAGRWNNSRIVIGRCVAASERRDAVSGIDLHKVKLIAVVLCAVCLVWSCTDIDARKASFVEKGEQLMAAGDVAKARLEFKNALTIDDKDAHIWYLLGQSEQASGDIKQAFAAYNRSVELDPTYLPAQLKKGQILIGGGALDQAEEVLARVEELAPDDAGVSVMSGALKRRRGDLEGAEVEIMKALSKKPEHREGLLLLALVQADNGDLSAAEVTLRKGIAAHPDITGFQVLLIQLFEKQSRNDEAVALLKDLIQSKPDVVGYRVRLAGYLKDIGRSDEAEDVLQVAVSTFPENTEIKMKYLEFLSAERGLPHAIAVTEELIAAEQDDAKLRLALARLHTAAGETEKAVSLYQNLIEAEPESPESVRARIQLAALYARKDKHDEAKQVVDQALLISAREPDALMLRATLVLTEDPDQAIADLRTVIHEYPDRASVHELLGQAHASKEEYALAQEAFEKAIELEPQRSSAYLLFAHLRVRTGDMDGALAVLNRLLEKVPDDAKALEAVAQIQMTRSDWEALAGTANQVQNDRPEHALGYYLEGVAAQKLDDHDRAIGAFENALQRSPNAVEPLVAMARSLFVQNRVDEAEQRVSVVLQDKPNDSVALNLLGDLKLAQGKPEQAKEYYDRAIEYHPKVARAYVQLAGILAAEQSFEDAIEVLKRGAREADQNAALLFQLANMHEKRGDAEAAITAYEELLKVYPDTVLAKNNLAMLLANHPEPKERLDKALQLAADFKNNEVPAFTDTLGWIRYQRGEYELAAAQFESIVSKYPQMAESQYHLAMAYAKLGRTADSKAILERILTGNEAFSGRSGAERLLAKLAGARD